MKRKLSSAFCAAVVIVFVAISCSKKSEDAMTLPNTPPATDCDTVNMKYSTDVAPILSANCYNCHGNGAAAGGVALDDYAAVKSLADNGDLVGVITHASGYSPMPKGGAKLSDCDIDKIKDWISRGTQNN